MERCYIVIRQILWWWINNHLHKSLIQNSGEVAYFQFLIWNITLLYNSFLSKNQCFLLLCVMTLFYQERKKNLHTYMRDTHVRMCHIDWTTVFRFISRFVCLCMPILHNIIYSIGYNVIIYYVIMPNQLSLIRIRILRFPSCISIVYFIRDMSSSDS